MTALWRKRAAFTDPATDGQSQLTVALTKATSAWTRRGHGGVKVLAAARQLWLRRYRLFVTAANEGRGIAELRAHLQQLYVSHAARHHFRLAADRCVYGERGGTGGDRNGAERR